ncbi:MAG TPA: HD domain-containing protein [Anaerolineales bacterium]|nr:HD domain-containing protein [Anaerolineales bacterium]
MEDDRSQTSYAGRWVARLHGRVIAQGGTPELARRAAKSSRYKETPEIIYMPVSLQLPPLVDKVRAALPDQEMYLVGGAVRDMLLGRFSRDLDFALPSNGISLARRVARALDADFMILDDERDTGRVIVTGEDGARTFLDFATYRGGAELESDLQARDFTINALAYDLRAEAILDPLEGAADIRTKRIRACAPTSFTDDPVRVLRAVRQAAELGFQIEKETRGWMKQAAGQVGRVSPERQRDELFKMLEGPKPDASIRALEILGVLPQLLPELVTLKGVEQSSPHVHDVWIHTLSVLKHLEAILAALAVGYNADSTNDLYTGLLTFRIGRYRQQFADHFAAALNADRSLRALLFFAALYHDIAKPQTRTVEANGRVRFLGHDAQGVDIAAHRAEEFHLSNDEIQRLRLIVAHHMRFHSMTSRMEREQQEPSRKAIYRFFRDGEEAGPDLVLLGLADLRATQEQNLKQEDWGIALDVARILLENYWEKREEAVAPLRLVDGRDLMNELKLEAGPMIGQLLEAIREAQAMGRVETREQAFDFARIWLKENRDKIV